MRSKGLGNPNAVTSRYFKVSGTKKGPPEWWAFLKFGKKRFLPATFVVASAATAITATTTTAIASTAATATVSTVSATTTASAVLLWATLFSFVDAEIATHKVGSVHFFDCFAGEVVVSKCDESEPARAVGFAIKWNEEVFDGSVCGECFANVFIRSGEWQIAEVQFHSL